jgi:hypothetical protein
MLWAIFHANGRAAGAGLAAATTQDTAQHPPDDLPTHLAANRAGGAFYKLFANTGAAAPSSAAHEVAQTI